VANSIAKLAILLTADASGLGSGMSRAQQVVKGFNTNISASAGGTGKFFGMFGKATVVTAATAVLASFARHGVRAGMAMEEMEAKTVRAWQESRAALGQFDGAFASTANTLTGRLAKLGASFNAFSAAATAPLQRLSKNSATIFSKMFDDMAVALGGESGTAFTERMKKMEDETTAAKEHAKKLEDTFKKLAAEHEKWVNSMRSQAESVTESVRTPMEALADRYNQLRELVNKGFITVETFTRATKKELGDMLDAERRLMESKSRPAASVGAAERFTTSGRSELRQAVEEAKRQAALALEEVRISREILRIEKEALDLAKERKPVTLIKSRL
jgi:hypothetical protein